MKTFFTFTKNVVIGLMLTLVVATVVSAQDKCHLLMVSGHARSEVSVATKTIMEEVKNAFPEAELLYLDQTYPDFKIDIRCITCKHNSTNCYDDNRCCYAYFFIFKEVNSFKWYFLNFFILR